MVEEDDLKTSNSNFLVLIFIHNIGTQVATPHSNSEDVKYPAENSQHEEVIDELVPVDPADASRLMKISPEPQFEKKSRY